MRKLLGFLRRLRFRSRTYKVLAGPGKRTFFKVTCERQNFDGFVEFQFVLQIYPVGIWIWLTVLEKLSKVKCSQHVSRYCDKYPPMYF